MRIFCFIALLVSSVLSCTASSDNAEAYNGLISKTAAYPVSYADEAEHQGRIERIDYDTRDYAEGTGRSRTNTAYVYLPYGYDENSNMRIIVYEIRGKDFIPVMNKPLYVDCGKIEKDRDYNVTVDKGIALYKGHDYYIGMCLVAGSKGGTISFPAYLHNAYARNLLNGNTKKLPASIGISLVGVKMGKQ